jgi:hypothetical protein
MVLLLRLNCRDILDEIKRLRALVCVMAELLLL